MSVDGDNTPRVVQRIPDDSPADTLAASRPQDEATLTPDDPITSPMPLPPALLLENASLAAVEPALVSIGEGKEMGSASAAAARPLNATDALGYLNCVKQQLKNQTDVYKRFLDIMKDFKSQQIDTPGVIGCVCTLFRGYPNLLQGFNTFLPAGYRIECSIDGNLITVTTPSGTRVRELERGMLYAELGRENPTLVTPSNMGDIERAITFVQSVKSRYADDPDKYKAFKEIFSSRDFKEEDAIARVQSLFKDDMDLMKGIYHFLPDRDTRERMAAHLDEMEETRIHTTEARGGSRKAGDAATATKGATGATVPQGGEDR